MLKNLFRKVVENTDLKMVSPESLAMYRVFYTKSIHDDPNHSKVGVLKAKLKEIVAEQNRRHGLPPPQDIVIQANVGTAGNRPMPTQGVKNG